jgi:hypothetical protein
MGQSDGGIRVGPDRMSPGRMGQSDGGIRVGPMGPRRMRQSDGDIRVGPGRVGPGGVSPEDDLKLLMAIVRTYVKEDTLALGAIIIERYPEYHSIKKWLANKFKNKWGPMVGTIIASAGLNVGAFSLLALATSLTAVGGTVAGILGAAGLAVASPVATSAGLAYGIGHLANKAYSSFKKHFGETNRPSENSQPESTKQELCNEECQRKAEETREMRQITKPIRDPSSGNIIGYSMDIAVTNYGLTPRDMITVLKEQKIYFNDRDGGKEGKEGEEDGGNIRQGLLDVLRTAPVPPGEREKFEDAERALGEGQWVLGDAVEPSVLKEGRVKIFDMYGRVIKDPANLGLRKVVAAHAEAVPHVGMQGGNKGKEKKKNKKNKKKKKGDRPPATCGTTRDGQERKMIDCTPANLPASLKCEWDQSKQKCIPEQPPTQTPPPTQTTQEEGLPSTTPISETSDEILMDKNGNYYLLTLKDTTKKRTRKLSCAQYSNEKDLEKCCDISGCARTRTSIYNACIKQSFLENPEDNKCPPESNSSKTTIANKAEEAEKKAVAEKAEEAEKKAVAKKAEEAEKKAAAKKAEEEANKAKAAKDKLHGSVLNKIKKMAVTNGGAKRTRRKKRHRKKRTSRTTRKR